MNWAETKAFLFPCLPAMLRDEMDLMYPGELRELRIRVGRPALLRTGSRSALLPWMPDAQQVETLAEALSEHSLYARGDETGRGFVTLRGGHRMGLCGSMAGREGRRSLKHITSLCIRIAAEWPDCAAPLRPLCLPEGRAESLLIIGPPGSGKTTLLRDLARLMGELPHPPQVALIDERGELAACMNGVPQLDVGQTTDVLHGCPRPEAVQWLMRSMAPEVIVTDELVTQQDAAALCDALSMGATVMASIHAASLNEAASRSGMASLMARRAFAHYAVLSPEGGGRIAAIYDRHGSPVPLP